MSPKITVPIPQTPSFVLEKDALKQLSKLKISRPEVRIVYFGSPQVSALVLERLLEFCQNSPFPEPLTPTFVVQCVVTQPDKPVGRKQIMTASPVALLAQRHHLPILKPSRLDEDFLKNHLPLLDSDLFIVAAYGKIIPPNILDIPKFGALNIHPSLLPKYRGPSPIQAAILNGDKVSGVTIIKMDEKMDHGPIVNTKEIRLSNQDTSATLSKKLFEVGVDLLIKIIPDFLAGKINLQLQDDAISKALYHTARGKASLRRKANVASYCNLVKKEDGYFDISNPPSPEKLDRMIRAYYPWPTAWTRWSPSQPRKVQPCEAKIIKFLPGCLVQMEGKKPVKLEDFLNGYPDFPLKSSHLVKK